MTKKLASLLLLLAWGIVSSARANPVVVFNEIMYHPATNEPASEWVEFYNQNAVDVDLSGWRITDGIDYTFPSGAVIRGGGYLVVAISPETLMAATGLTNVLGPFSGRLSNSGEKMELRDLANRLMDAVNYSTDGDWPAGADGSGASLAKTDPNSASQLAGNWRASAQIGGMPGAANFGSAPFTGAKTNLLAVTAAWRYEDSGADLGADWKAPGYEDSGWASGPGLFYVENAPLPGPKSTPLAPDRNTYYFRATFPFDGDPATKLLSFKPIVDDGAIVYLNGKEIYRFNMPTGAVSYSTMATSAVLNAVWAGAVSVASSNLVVGQNVLAVELHQTSVNVNPGLKISPSSGYAMTWDGSDGDFSTPASPAPAPSNAALASLGADVVTSSNPSAAARINDGLYGSGSSWSPAATDANPSIVVRFNQTLPISSIAWSRDNGDTNESGCGGTCTDRALGKYTIEYTAVADPASVVLTSGDPATGWATLGVVQYLSAQPGFAPHLRHRFDFNLSTGAPLLATGMRLRLTSSNSVDEIEINPPAVSNFDAVFGLELTATDLLPPLPKLAFNEVSAAATAGFWLEIMNTGDTPAELSGVQVVHTGTASPAYNFPARTLAPGGLLALTQAELGFGAADGTQLFLLSPGGYALLDAVTVRPSVRGRHPDGAGEWLFPSPATPGVSNLFVLRDDIVVNEIMYHHRPYYPDRVATSNATLVPIDGAWRFNESGADLGTAWRARGYDDISWPLGAGLFAVNAGSLPGPTNTVLTPGRSTYYFRTQFSYSAGASDATLRLRAVINDGAIFYLNGVEVSRINLPAGPVSHADSAADAVMDNRLAGPTFLSVSNLVQGHNVLAVEGHPKRATTNFSGITLAGGGLRLVEEGPLGGIAPPNLARQPGAAPFVIDSLAGIPIHDFAHLNDGIYGNANSWIGNSGTPGYAGVRLGGLFTVSGIAFGRDNSGTFFDRTLGLYTLQSTRVAVPAATTPTTGDPNTGWAPIGTLNYQRIGVGLFANPSRRHRFAFTPVEATGLRLLVPLTGIGLGTCIDELEVNPPDTADSVAFGAELVLRTLASQEEWIELYNRGTSTVSLANWQIEGAIRYRFAAGAAIPPGGYLVVANDTPALQARWPEIAGQIVGNFSGRMSGQEVLTLRDAAGNPVNRTRIFAGGWSDGGGSSLELIDPRADNSAPGAWADSDERVRSAWQTVSYRMVAGQTFGNTLWNEFRLGLLDAGVALVDDVSVLRDPDGARQQMIQNGDFELTTGNVHWRMLGDHQQSQIIVDPENPANHVLRVAASSPARTSHNHIESSFVANTPIVDGQLYEVSCRARWQAGSPQLNTSAYFSRLAKTTLLPLPLRHGTPGQPNSRRVANAGPALSALQHSPVIPKANEAVTVLVRAGDPDGLGLVTLFYRVNPATAFTSAPMALQADGTWTAVVPGQATGKIVQFYARAEDSLGAESFAPEQGPDSRALYQVADAQGKKLTAHELRLIQLDADRDFMLRMTNVMSQARLGGTVIYDRSEVFYDAAVRLHGSAAGRARDGEEYISYDIGFPAAHLFRGGVESVGIDRSGRAPVVRQQDEIYVQHMFHRAGIPSHYSDLCYFIAPRTGHTGTAILQLGGYGGLYVDEQYGADGSVFNMDLTYEPSQTVPGGTYESLKVPVPLQGHERTDFADLGPDQEQYRAPWDIRYGESADDYSGIMRLCQVMGSSQARFDAEIEAALEVDEALRVAALTMLCGLVDIYYAPDGLPHNLRLFTPAAGGPAHFLPWDMDFVFQLDSGSSIYPNPSSNFYKLMNNRLTQRRYLRHVRDLCQTVFNSAYMSPWLAHYGSVVGQSYTGQSSYINSRRSSALSQAAPFFTITSNGGKDFLTNSAVATIAGRGSVDIETIRLAGVSEKLAVTWASGTNWQISVPLLLGSNLLSFVAYDASSNMLGSDSITVTTTATGGGVDSDGDGMPDAWELANGLNPALNDATLDKDGDGLTNLEEFLTGTNPGDAHDFLRLEAGFKGSDKRLSFFAVAGRSYSVVRRDEAGGGIWSKFTDAPARATNRLVEVLLPSPLPVPARFYRLVTPQQ